jgi:chaperonin GroEL
LSSGISIIKVGANTDVEAIGRLHSVEDSIQAVRSAQTEGILAGGGAALIASSGHLLKSMGDLSEEEQLCFKIMSRACLKPFQQIMINANYSPDLMLQHVSGEHGIDAKTGWCVNLFDEGIVDAAKVTKLALSNAVSVATTILMCECAFIEE